MVSRIVIEGTGEEIAGFVRMHPADRFQLVALQDEELPRSRSGPDPETWDEVIQAIHSFKGRLPVLPTNATTTESLYPD